MLADLVRELVRYDFCSRDSDVPRELVSALDVSIRAQVMTLLPGIHRLLGLTSPGSRSDVPTAALSETGSE